MWVSVPDARIGDEVQARLEVDPRAVAWEPDEKAAGCGPWLTVVTAFLCGVVAGALCLP